jgi:hypothetical protein
MNTSVARSLLISNLQDNDAGGITAADVRQVISSTLDAVDKAENPVVSVKDYGAVGDGVADDTVAIQTALNESNVIFVPAGTYRITSTLTVTGRNGIRFLGASMNATTIQWHGSTGNVMTFTNCAFCSVENLTFQHGAGTGSGLVFTGAGGSNNVHRCAFNNNSVNGLAFTGSAGAPQSGNKVTGCLFLINGAEQLLFSHAHDPVVETNAFGNAGAPYSVAGCKFSNSSAGRYAGNESWGNLNGVVLESCSFVRINANRIEENRREGLLSTGSYHCVFADNLLHTNSQSATGSYSAMRLSGCGSWTITGNQTLSWDSATYKHKNGLELDASCFGINIVGNSFYHNTGQPIGLNSATDIFTSSNHPVLEEIKGSVLSFDVNAGGGTIDARAAILAAAGTGQVHFAAGTYRVASNLTLSVPVKFDARAKLSIDAGVVVTLWGKLDSPDQQIFTGAGTVTGLTLGVRPEWWGALHDGATDDAPAINAAVACVGNSGGGTVVFTNGFYVIYSPILINWNNVQLNGLGRRVTYLRNATLTLNTVTVASGIRYWAVRDMSIFHFLTLADGTVKTTAGAGISAVDAQLGIIERVDVNGAYRGIDLGNSVGTHVSSFEIETFVVDGIRITGNANDMFIRDGIINGAFGGVAGTGNTAIRLDNKCEAIFLSDLDILLADYGLQTTSTGTAAAGTNAAWSYFKSCFFDSCRSGVLFHRATGIHLTDCWFSNRPNHGCVVRESLAISFTSCTFANCDQHGCVVEATSKHTRFTSCTFDSNGQAATGSYDGLSIAAGTTDFIVTGCTATNTGRFGIDQRNGIRVNTGASDRYIIADNLVSGNTSTGVIDSGTGVNKRVANNY